MLAPNQILIIVNPAPGVNSKGKTVMSVCVCVCVRERERERLRVRPLFVAMLKCLDISHCVLPKTVKAEHTQSKTGIRSCVLWCAAQRQRASKYSVLIIGPFSMGVQFCRVFPFGFLSKHVKKAMTRLRDHTFLPEAAGKQDPAT